MITKALDLTIYLKNLIEINEEKAKEYAIGLSETKLGGYYYCKNTKSFILMKFIVYPDDKCVIQVTFENDENKEIHLKLCE